MPDSDDARRKESARRPKPQLSCTICKSKKARCDQKLPCGNCRKRPPGSCVYVPKSTSESLHRAIPQPQPQQGLSHVHDHLSQPDFFLNSTVGTSSKNTADRDRPLSPKSYNDDQFSLSSNPGLASHDLEIRLIDTTSWEAVLREFETTQSNTPVTQDASSSAGWPLHPALLFDVSKDASIEDLVNSLPSKPIADQLVNLFSHGIDMPSLPIHLPTFLKDYKAFWDNPDTVTLPWLSILFSVITLTIQFVLQSGTKLNGIIYMESACKQYTSKAAECLRRSDYAKPAPLTVEAMLMYFFSEHLWLGDFHFRASLLLTFAIRLAMRSGYHRDPSHYDQISVFNGEMRRRTWSSLVQLDLLFASFLGLPPHIGDHQTDTALPANIADEDLYPEMTSLPPSRPPEEPSSMGFLNHRAQLTKLLGQIADYTTSFYKLSYEKILDLDRALDIQVDTRPIWLACPVSTVPLVGETTFLNRAIEIDVLQQRARMILHRRYLALARVDPKYVFSRDRCLAAALQVLRHQQNLSSMAFKVDCMVVKNWRALAFMSQEILLSAMIVCLDVDQELRYGPLLCSSACGTDGLEERLALLKSCHKILAGGKNISSSTQKAAHAIQVVFSQADTALNCFTDEEMIGDTSSRGQRGFHSTLAPADTLIGASFGAATPDASNSASDTSFTSFDPMYPHIGFPQTSEFLQTMVEDFSTGLNWNACGF